MAAPSAGTPAYLYDLTTLDADARALAAAFPDPWLRLYALKANGLPPLVARLPTLGMGASAVSRGELWLAHRAGFEPAFTALEGIGKATSDLRAAVELARAGTPLAWVSIESADEAAALARLVRNAARRGPLRLDVLVRLNPAVRPETHRGLGVGAADSKFGILADELPAVVEVGGGPEGPLRWRGLHVHVGSQLGAVDAWRSGLRVGLATLALSRSLLPEADTFDAGSGFPVLPPGDAAPTLAHFSAAARELLDDLPASSRPRRLAIEPGRSVVARSGWLLTRVLHVRERETRQVIVDAGMTELIRPALYGARHPIVALTSLGRPWDREEPEQEVGAVAGAPFAVERALSARGADRSQVEGPTATIDRVEGAICESTDQLGEAALPALRRGDLVAIGLAGAYASAMSSRYNGRPAPPELSWDGVRVETMRRRGSLASLP